MASLPSTYTAAVSEVKGEKLAIKQVELKKPGPGQVLVKVLACGICHTDSFMIQGLLGDVFPRIPGHELVGDVVAVGEGVTRFKGGERVGGPWHGGHDATCRSCQSGNFQMCNNAAINGVTMDGGYATYALLRSEAVVNVPKEMDPAEVAPLLCAGVTVFNGMRNMDVRPGSLVAVQGLGGLGHLAVQYANKMGYRTVALSHGDKKREFAMKLGAHEYIDTSKEDPVKKLQEMGGADMIVATAPNAKAISPLVKGLGMKGKLVILAPVGEVPVDTFWMINHGASVYGWPSGHALDSEDAIAFAQRTGVRCMVEKFKLGQVEEALEHMRKGDVRFRGVLVME